MARSFSGRYLREARVAAGVRPERLAIAIERSVHTIDAYEHGHVVPPLAVAARLADVLGVHLDDLLADIEEPARVA